MQKISLMNLHNKIISSSLFKDVNQNELPVFVPKDLHK